MKNFNFKLERLLKIKEHKEKLAKLAYAKVLQKKVLLETENNTLMNEIGASGNVLDKDPGEAIDYSNIENLERFVIGAEAKIRNNKSDITGLEPELNDLKDKLSEAMKEKKIMEKLKEKKYKRFKDEVKQHETMLLDEVAATMQFKNPKEDL